MVLYYCVKCKTNMGAKRRESLIKYFLLDFIFHDFTSLLHLARLKFVLPAVLPLLRSAGAIFVCFFMFDSERARDERDIQVSKSKQLLSVN